MWTAASAILTFHDLKKNIQIRMHTCHEEDIVGTAPLLRASR